MKELDEYFKMILPEVKEKLEFVKGKSKNKYIGVSYALVNKKGDLTIAEQDYVIDKLGKLAGLRNFCQDEEYGYVLTINQEYVGIVQDVLNNILWRIKSNNE